jgi:hypothetical protein
MQHECFLTRYSQYIGDKFIDFRNKVDVYLLQFLSKLMDHSVFMILKF